MYELYFGDETMMPSAKSQRFKNFQKHFQQQRQGSYQASSGSGIIEEEPMPQIILPEEIVNILEERDITETPFIMIRSNLSSKSEKGEAYAIGFDEFLVIMWKKSEGEPFKLVKMEHYDIIDVSGGVEESDDSIIVLMISTEERTYSLWFQESQTDELVTFINSWKYHQVHRIGGKTDIEFGDEAIEYSEARELPELDGVAQKDLPRTVIFGTVLIDQVAEGHNITELDLEYLNMTITNPDLLAMCIQNFKRDVTEEAKELVKDEFNNRQKLMLLTNMADLAFRNGDTHDEELLAIKDFSDYIGFDSNKTEEVIELFRLKNDASALESY